MARKYGKCEVSYNFIGEFVEDCSSFKIVPKARDPKTVPTMRNGKPGTLTPPNKKSHKKKNK